jgi:high affinity Mn2+ porin
MKYKISLTLSIFFYSFLLKAQQESFKSFEQNKFDSSSNWTYHFQLTTIYQIHPAFSSKVSGLNSLTSDKDDALSLTTTLFIGRKLWKNASFYFNPEIAGGMGLGSVLGMGGAFNGETFRVGNIAPTPYVARCYIQQHFSIGTSKNKEYLNNDFNQVKEDIPESRITVSVGKFSIADFFDHNLYAHDPRTKFMNWSLMSGTGWDYPANVRGYTWGGVVELIKPTWEIRFSSCLVPLLVNGAWMDWNYSQAHSEAFEIEKKVNLNKHTGKIRLLLFRTVSKAVSYHDAINGMKTGDSSMNSVITGESLGNKYGGVKYGFVVNMDQEITDDIGIFGRVSWNDGKTCIWAFTEVDESASFGLSVNGKKWKRQQDVFGIAYVVDGISQDHIDYLNAGGLTFMIGDGKGNLNYQPEQIMETFYNLNLTPSLWLTADYQLAFNPGYNKDRGPVNVFGLRLHIEF